MIEATLVQEIQQAQDEVVAAESSLNHAEPLFVDAAVLQLSASRERLNALYKAARDDMQVCGHCGRTTDEPLNRFGVHEYCLHEDGEDE